MSDTEELNNKNLDEVMSELDEKIRQLEEDSLSLEESYKVFSEGMELVKAGNSTIDRVEKQLQILMEDE